MNNEQPNQTIALVGNPNCGKTTIFNALTGSNQHVGNYSGVTVERKEGFYKFEGKKYRVLDLPGTYSLSYHSPEERIAQDELLSGDVDVLVAIVDAGTLSRSLVFVAQLMQLDLSMVLCLNMWDEAERSGLVLDLKAMENLLGFPVIQTVGSKNTGLEALRNLIAENKPKKPGSHLKFSEHLSNAIYNTAKALPPDYCYKASWVATKLLLEDPTFVIEIQNLEGNHGKKALEIARSERKHIESDTAMDIQLYLTESYYGFVDGLLKEVILKKQRADARAVSDHIDRVLVHPYLGLPIFLLIVYLLFDLTFRIGQYPMSWLEHGFSLLSSWIDATWVDANTQIMRSLLVDGIIGGVGGVIVFLPNILILFLGLSFLEDCGYMARTAFLMDRIMHRFGLHGRSFIPLITGFGCTIPGLLATRTIAGEKERMTTQFILPLMSCGARLPIWLLLVPVFFPPAWNAPALMGIYLLGIVVALLLAKILRKTLFKGEDEPFVMELPPYRVPTLRATLTHMLERAWLYLKKAGTIILAVSILLWALASFPQLDETTEQNTILAAQAESEVQNLSPENTQKYVNASIKRAELENSALGNIGKAIEPAIQPMGFDWKIGTALLGAFAAKEVFVAQMGILYSTDDSMHSNPSTEPHSSDTLREKIKNDYSPLVGISLIIFLLIATPCTATFATMRRETNSWKWPSLQFLTLTLLAYILSTLVFQLGMLLIA